MAGTSERSSGSPTPPPLPDEPLPGTANATEDAPVDQPITTLGGDEDEDEEDEDEDNSGSGADAVQGSSGAQNLVSPKKSKGKGKQTDARGSSENTEAQPWQAVWSAEQNAWYFWNTITGEVTWTNPLQPAPEAESTTTSDPTFQPPLPQGPPPAKPDDAPRQIFSNIPDIDPDLAYLLPPDQRGIGGSSADATAQSAQFNARSGKFTTGDINYRFDALDEYNRQKRFNDHYFDVDAWQKQKDEEHAKRKRDEELGIVRDNKITKKDMDRFRKKKAEQKWRKQAWLRD